MTLPCITCTKDPRLGSCSHGCAELTAYFTAKAKDKDKDKDKEQPKT